MDLQIYETAIALLHAKASMMLWLVPVAIIMALALAFAFIIAFDRLMRAERWVFGSWIKTASSDAKAGYYALLVGATVGGALVCVGLVVLGVFSG